MESLHEDIPYCTSLHFEMCSLMKSLHEVYALDYSVSAGLSSLVLTTLECNVTP